MIGLTGSLGSGKSEVRQFFASMGAFTIDADQIGRELSTPGEAAYNEIVEYWGRSVLNPDGTLNRRALADVAFVNSEETDHLDEIFHPNIIKREDEMMEEFTRQAESGIIVTEAALIIEVGRWSRFDRLLLVTCPETIRKERVMRTRNMDSGMFDLISRRQKPDEEKRKVADYVIENNGTLNDLEMQSRRIYYRLSQDLLKKRGLE